MNPVTQFCKLCRGGEFNSHKNYVYFSGHPVFGTFCFIGFQCITSLNILEIYVRNLVNEMIIGFLLACIVNSLFCMHGLVNTVSCVFCGICCSSRHS